MPTMSMKVWTLVDIALRVPPVFVMDAALNYGLGPTTGSDQRSEYVSSPEQTVEASGHQGDDVASGCCWFVPSVESFTLSFFWLLLYLIVFFIALFVFLLSTKQLVAIYIRLASVAIILISYKLNVDHVSSVTSHSWQHMPVTSLGMSRLAQVTWNYFLPMIFCVLFSFTNTVAILPRSVMCLLFLFPTVLSAFSLPSFMLHTAPVLSAAGCFALLAYSMWTHGLRVCETVYKGVTWCHNVVENYGLYTMLETHWLSLHIPQVFRIFWLIRLAKNIIFLLGSASYGSWSLCGIFKDMIVRGSENIVAILGMTSVVAFLAQKFGYVMQAFLLVDDPEERSVGNVSAILFFILALQTGVTGLDPEKRFIRIYRNLCLLFTALLHFIHNVLNPILLSLSASRNPAVQKHVRALLVSAFLILAPIFLLIHQWSYQSTSTWLLAVTSFMVELIVKATTSILIYALFMIDAYRNGLWEKLDDYVYYLKAAASTIEFLFGIFLLLNGAWIFVFESGGAIRACMMCLHAYFNIWVQAKSGWESYLKRRSALNKINILPEATQQQLKERNDVCAICFQDLNSARITLCNHYFHGVCLRKWLNVQDTCPLCHTPLCDNRIVCSSRQSQWGVLRENVEARFHR